MIFTATFAEVSASAAQDVFSLVAPATSRLRLREVTLSQFSDAAELLGIQFITGYTDAGTGGAEVTPANTRPWSRAAAATVRRNDTGLAATGTAVIRRADFFNIEAGYIYRPADMTEAIHIDASVRLVIRMTAPADAITLSGTLVFEELGLYAG